MRTILRSALRWAAGVTLLALVPTASNATRIQGSFTGVVTSAASGSGATVLAPGNIAVGSPIAGTFSYDTEAIPQNTSSDPSSAGLYQFVNGGATFSISVNGSRWAGGPTVFIEAAVPPPGFQIQGYQPLVEPSGATTGYISFALLNDQARSSINLLTSPVLPTSASQFHVDPIYSGSNGQVVYGYGGFSNVYNFNIDPKSIVIVDNTPPPNAAPAFSVAPSALLFNTINTNAQSTAQAVTLSNGGNVPLIFSPVLLTGDNPGDYLIAPGSTCIAGPVAVGSSCTFGVAFQPTAAGQRVARVAINAIPVVPTQYVNLTGIGGALSASASKIDKRISKHCDPNESILTFALEKARCDQIEGLRNLFSVNLTMVSNDALYNWLGAKENREFIQNLQKKIAFGQMAQAYANQTGQWNSDSYYQDVKNLSDNALALEQKIGGLILSDSAAFQFMSSALGVIGEIQNAYAIYKSGLSSIIGTTPQMILSNYQQLRSASPNDLSFAQHDIRVDGGYTDKIIVMLCSQKKFGTCSGKEPTEAQWATFFRSLEEAYQAMRLAGTGDDSQQLRSALGMAIANAINLQ